MISTRSLSSEFGRLLHEPAAGKRDEPTQQPELSPLTALLGKVADKPVSAVDLDPLLLQQFYLRES
jgi:hypothetical protein